VKADVIMQRRAIEGNDIFLYLRTMWRKKGFDDNYSKKALQNKTKFHTP